MSWKEDPPTIIEHTTVEPVIERNTIIERDNWYSEPWAIAMVIGAIAIIGLVAYWALYNPSNQPPTYVSNTTIERPAPDQRAQTMAPAPTINVTPPASPAPTVNVNPPATTNNTPPVVINNTPSSSNNPPENNSGSSNNGTDAGDTSGTSSTAGSGGQ